jgi:hypothetical protein
MLSGERGRNRTFNLLIKSSTQTKNQQLATNGHRASRVATKALLGTVFKSFQSSKRALCNTRSGLVVGTKLGTVGNAPSRDVHQEVVEGGVAHSTPAYTCECPWGLVEQGRCLGY